MFDGKNLDKSVPGVACVCMPAQRAPGFPADPHPINEVLAKADRHENAAIKELCGMCSRDCKLNPIGVIQGKCLNFSQKPSVIRLSQKKAKGICKVPPGVVMMYFGRPSRLASRHHGAIGHAGIITAAVRVKESPNLIEIGFSFCSPADSWCKVKGRDTALERLVMNPLIVPYLYEPLKMARQAVTAVARHDWKRLSQFGVMPLHLPDHVPSWTKGLAANERKIPVRREITLFGRTMGKSLLQQLMSRPPAGYFSVEEAAPVPPEAWECLRKGTPTDILGRMLKDIARVGAK